MNSFDPNQSPFWKPKFIVAAFILVVAAVALFSGHIDQETFTDLAKVIFGGFALASVVENKLLKPAAPPS